MRKGIFGYRSVNKTAGELKERVNIGEGGGKPKRGTERPGIFAFDTPQKLLEADAVFVTETGS